MSPRKAALLVGIDDYPFAPLAGCVADVRALQRLLSTHEDGSSNFDCRSLTAERHGKERVTRSALKSNLREVLGKQVDMALFYFSGHGFLDGSGGVLVTQDAAPHDEGVAMSDVIDAANRSRIPEVTIVLDCCHAGKMGDAPIVPDRHAVLREGVSVLSASAASEPSVERQGRGVFTSLVCAALDGGAADVIGDVTLASTYAFAEQVLGPLDQRPMYKANVSRMSPLRRCQPSVPPAILRRLKDYFPAADHDYRLDPSYEQDAAHHPPGTIPSPAHQAIFRDLQTFNRARLLVPVGEHDMFWAAIRFASCRLTPLGRFYWRLARDGRV